MSVATLYTSRPISTGFSGDSCTHSTLCLTRPAWSLQLNTCFPSEHVDTLKCFFSRRPLLLQMEQYEATPVCTVVIVLCPVDHFLFVRRLCRDAS